MTQARSLFTENSTSRKHAQHAGAPPSAAGPCAAAAAGPAAGSGWHGVSPT